MLRLVMVGNKFDLVVQCGKPFANMRHLGHFAMASTVPKKNAEQCLDWGQRTVGT